MLNLLSGIAGYKCYYGFDETSSMTSLPIAHEHLGFIKSALFFRFIR